MQELGTDHTTQVVVIVSLTIGTIIGSFLASILNKDINSIAWRSLKAILSSNRRRHSGR